MKTNIILIAACLYFGVLICVSNAPLYIKVPVCIVFAFLILVLIDGLIHIIKERRAK